MKKSRGTSPGYKLSLYLAIIIRQMFQFYFKSPQATELHEKLVGKFL